MTHEQVKASLARITRSSYGTSALLEHSANSNNKCTCCTNIHQTQLVYRMSKNLPRLNHIFGVRKDEVLALSLRKSLRSYFRSIAVSKLPRSSKSYDADFAHVNGFPRMLTHILKELSTTSTYDLNKACMEDSSPS